MDTARSTYSREDVLRLLRISPQQLSGWAKAGLIAVREQYSFQDLSQLRKLCSLRGQGIPTAAIRESVQAMKAVVGGTGIDASAAVSTSHGVAFRHQGAVVNPVNGQFEIDFDRPQAMVSVVAVKAGKSAARTFNTRRAQELFRSGGEAEEAGDADGAVKLYEQAIELDPEFVACYINIGTVRFHARRFDEAEKMYRAALKIDGEYALAHFDLGNTLDEVGRLVEAAAAYEAALRAAPGYADAYFNLALVYDRQRRCRDAIRCFKAYLRLDKTSEWAQTARRSMQSLLATDPLKIVSRNPDLIPHRVTAPAGDRGGHPGLRLVACHARRLDHRD